MAQISRLKVFQPGKKALSADVNGEFDNLLNAHNENDVTLSDLLNTLQSILDGNSGAGYVGATPIPELTGNTVQQLLESLKALDDSNKQYLLNQIGNVALGQIPDSSITDVKLSNDPADIKQRVAAHTADYVKHPGAGTTTNTGNAYAVTLNPVPTSYVANIGIVVTINADSTGATTLNVNGLGAKPILKSNGNAVSNLKANGVYTVRYNPAGNGGTGAFILQGEGASGNAVASDLRSGKTASTDAGDIVGALDLSNVQPNNIKLGVQIDNVTGTLTPLNEPIQNKATWISMMVWSDKYSDYYFDKPNNRFYFLRVGVNLPYVEKRTYDQNGTLLSTNSTAFLTSANVQWTRKSGNKILAVDISGNFYIFDMNGTKLLGPSTNIPVAGYGYEYISYPSDDIIISVDSVNHYAYIRNWAGTILASAPDTNLFTSGTNIIQMNKDCILFYKFGSGMIIYFAMAMKNDSNAWSFSSTINPSTGDNSLETIIRTFGGTI